MRARLSEYDKGALKLYYLSQLRLLQLPTSNADNRSTDGGSCMTRISTTTTLLTVFMNRKAHTWLAQ